MSHTAATGIPGGMLRVRFNTNHNGSLHWRVIIDDIEHLADHLSIHVPVFDTEDILPDGSRKFHLSCHYNQLEWKGSTLIVR